MSKMAELAYDIEQLFIEGLTEKNIAKTLDIPVEDVYSWLAQHNIIEDEDAELEAFNMDEVDGPYYGA
jgi:orotate phosphoribosyltransferase-like protein